MLATLSKVYELIEWWFAIAMSPENAELYNGQQGDAFDAHKDMALALAGAIGAAVFWRAIGWRGMTEPRSPAQLASNTPR